MIPRIIKSIVAAIWLLLVANPLYAWQYEGVFPTGNARQVSSGGLMITWSENNDELRGFSNSLGEWETLKIEKQDNVVPVVGTDVAAVRIGDSIAAFSGVKGWWDLISLSKGTNAQPTVSDDLATVEDNGHLYTFSAPKGQWTSPTDPELQRAKGEVRGDGHYMGEAEIPFTRWLNLLPRHKARGIRVQFSDTGVATIYTDRHSHLVEVEQKIAELLQNRENIGEKRNSGSPSDVTVVPDIESRISRLRKELESLDRDITARSDRADPKAVRNIVEQMFDSRQELQRLEAQRMRLKLQLIEANLDARETRRRNIIERRIEQIGLGRLAFATPQTGEPESSGVQLFGFTASYCGPCQQMEPVMQRMMSDQFPVRMIDITMEPELTRQHQIDRIPTFVLMVGDKEVRRFIGLTGESELRTAMIKAAMQLAESHTKNSDLAATAEVGAESKVVEESESRLSDGVPEENIPAEYPRSTEGVPVGPSSGPRSGTVPWNETLLIKQSLAEKLADTNRFEQQLDDIRLRLANYRTPISKWNEAEKQDYSNAVLSFRTRLGTGTTKYDADLRTVRDANYERYVREGIVSTVIPGEVSAMSPTTDEVLDDIRLDLVRESESRLAKYDDRLELALVDWQETWNAYQSRLRLLRLDMDEAKLAVQQSQRNYEQKVSANQAAKVFTDSELADSASKFDLAKINLQRAEEILILYADIETQEPDLNPDSFKVEE